MCQKDTHFVMCSLQITQLSEPRSLRSNYTLYQQLKEKGISWVSWGHSRTEAPQAPRRPGRRQRLDTGCIFRMRGLVLAP